MDENTRRQITWVLIISAIVCVILIASYRKNELNRLRELIASGTPQQRVEAVRLLVRKQKLKEALEDQPRWVQDNAVAVIPLVGSNDAYYELLGCNAVLDAPVQARAQTVFTRLGRRGVEIYIEALQDKDATTAATAKQPLIDIGKAIENDKTAQTNEVIDGCKELLDAWDQPVRDAVRDILAGIASPRVVALLIPIMQQMEPQQTKRTKEGRLRKQTSQEFMRSKSTAQAALVAMAVPAIKPIIDQLITYHVPEVRGTACKMLGDIAVPILTTKAADVATMVPALLDRLNNDPEWAVRRRAATALGLLADVAKQNGAVQPLIAHLTDHNDVKAAAVEALGRLGDQAATEPLVNTLITNRTGASNELRIALTALGDPAIPQIVRALASPDTEVRLIAARAIAEIGGPNAVVPLSTVLKDPAVEIRRVAADALRAIADERVLGVLTEALGDADWQVYHAARDALARVGPAAVPFLVQALASTNPRVASMAQQALVRIGAPALGVLQATLSSPTEGQAHWAAIALGDIGPAALKFALAVLQDRSKSPMARAKAAMALGRTGAGDAVEPLMEALRKQEPLVKIEAMKALAALADERATPALVDALASEAPEVRDTAMDVLRDWRMPDTVTELQRVASSADVNARRRAMIAIAEQTSVAAHELLEQVAAGAGKTGAETGVDVRVLEEAAIDQRETPKVRLRAINALGYVGGPQTLDRLTVLLRPGDPYAGPAAVAAARIGSRTIPVVQEGVRPELSPAGKTLVDLLLSTTDQDLRIKTAAALSLMGEQPVWTLMERLKSASPQLKSWIIATLGAIGKPATDPVLEVFGESREPEYKLWLASALKLIADAQALDLLRHLPQNEQPPDEMVRPAQNLLDKIRAAGIG